MDHAAARRQAAAQPTVAVAARGGVGLAGIPGWAWVAVAVSLGILLVGILAYGYFGDRGQVPVQITYSGLTVTIGVSVEAETAGSSLRWGERVARIEGGVASFELPGDSLAPGPQELALQLEVPGETPEPYPAVIDVPLTIGVDNAGLSEQPPFVSVVIRVAEGVSLLVDGERQEPDASAVVRHRVMAVAEPDSGTFRSSVTVSGARGVTVLDEIRVPIEVPVAELRITDPLVSMITELREVEIAGRVASGSAVTVNGVTVPSEAGSFSQQVRLDEEGEHVLQVRVTAPGAVPQTRDIQIRRTFDLRGAAAEFGEDRSIRYEQLRERSEEIRGARILVAGEVYGASGDARPSYAQMLASECPRGERCPVWIRLPAGQSLTRGDRVEVYGLSSGYQDFVVNARDGQTRRQSVPRVDAVLVVPSRR